MGFNSGFKGLNRFRDINVSLDTYDPDTRYIQPPVALRNSAFCSYRVTVSYDTSINGINFCNEDGVCFMRGRTCIFKYNLGEIQSRSTMLGQT